MPPIQRQAKLKPEYADRYPGLKPNLWVPASELSRWVGARLPPRARTHGDPRGRVLDPTHFVFRTVVVATPIEPDGAADDLGTERSMSTFATLADLRVRGPLYPVSQQARVVSRYADVPDFVRAGHWYDVFAGPFPVGLAEANEVVLIAGDRLYAVPRPWVELREIEAKTLAEPA